MLKKMKKHIFNTILISIIISHIFPFITFSQDGSYDFTFGNAGIVVTPNDGDVNASALQTNGKIIVAGSSFGSTNYHFSLTRYNNNGSLDSTFGNNGNVITDIGSFSTVTAIKIQADGKILAAGYGDLGSINECFFAVCRYNTDGSLDNTFGNNGIVTTFIESTSSAYAIDLQEDGKILLAGNSKNTTHFIFAICRYNTNGSLDNTFGGDGIVTTNIGATGIAYGITIQVDGKIVMAGLRNSNGQSLFALTRYNTNGILDNTFGVNGIVTTSIGISSDAKAIAMQVDGKIVVAGRGNNNGQSLFALTRYNTNGVLDNTFGIGGIVTTSIGTFSRTYAIAIQVDGKIVVGGYSQNGPGTNYNICLSRYISNGNLDVTFGSNGIVNTFIGTSSSSAQAIAIQTDGKIVVGGNSVGGAEGSAINIIRLNNSLSAGISNYSNIKSEILIYPNPFSYSTEIKTNYFLENATFIVFNTLGEQVKKIDNIMGQTFTFYRENLEQGIYFYHLKENNIIVYENKFVTSSYLW